LIDTEIEVPEKYVSEHIISASTAGNIILRRTSYLKTVPDRYIVVFQLDDLELEGRGSTKESAFKEMLTKLRHSTQESETEFRGRFHQARARHEGSMYPTREFVTLPDSGHADRCFKGW
jgi:hypothetical protein